MTIIIQRFHSILAAVPDDAGGVPYARTPGAIILPRITAAQPKMLPPLKTHDFPKFVAICIIYVELTFLVIAG